MPSDMPASATVTAQGTQIGQILLLLLYLALIIAGAYLVTRLYGRIVRQGGVYSAKAGQRDGRRIVLIDRLPLGKEQSVVLIEYGGKRYLVGMGPDSFALLDKGDAPEEPAEETEGGRMSFMEALASRKKQGEHKDAP